MRGANNQKTRINSEVASSEPGAPATGDELLDRWMAAFNRKIADFSSLSNPIHDGDDCSPDRGQSISEFKRSHRCDPRRDRRFQDHLHDHRAGYFAFADQPAST